MPSMYRTILEADDVLTHQDPDNLDGAEDVKEIQDIVNDEDANAEEQEQGAEAAFGPDDGVEDIVDESMMFIAESEMAWQKIMHAVGMRELSEAAAGREAVLEAADIKGWFKAAKDKIVAFFKKVWQVIQRWAGNVLAMVTPNKSFAKKYATQIKKGEALYAKADKKLKGYPFTSGAIGTTDDPFIQDAKQADQGSKIVNDLAKAFASDIRNGMTFGDMKPAIDKAYDEMFKVYGVSTDADMSEIRDKAKEDMFGAKEPTEMTMSAADIIAILEDKGNVKKSTKKAMDNAQKQMKAAIKTLNDAQKAIEGVHKDDNTSANNVMGVASSLNTALNKMLSVTQVERSVAMSAITKRMHQARAFGNYYVRLANKDAKPGFQKESTEYGFLGSLNLV